MPFIFGQLGYVCAPIMLGMYFLLCGFLQQKVCEIALALPNVTTTPDLAFEVAGRFGMNFYQFLQVLNQQLFIPCAILFSVDALKKVVGPGDGATKDFAGMLSCNVVWLLLIIGFALLAANLVRRFGHAGWICKVTCALNAIQIVFIGVRVFLNEGDRTGSAEPFIPWPLNNEDYKTGEPPVATNRSNWVEVFQAISLFCYCYVPCFIATEAMQELQDKNEINKALWSSTALMYTIYVFVGLIPSVYWGWNRTENILNELHGDFFGRMANLTLFLASATDFLITSISLNQRVQELLDPDFNVFEWSRRAVLKWFFYTLPSFSISFLLLCFVPDLATLACLMTAFVVPFSQLIGPAVLTLMGSQKSITKKLASWETVVMYIGILVGIVMLVLGMSATVVNIYTLLADPETFAGNFFCDDVAG